MQKAFAVLFCLTAGIACGANIITVDDDGPADYTTIQAAIDASGNGDIVVVCLGTYTDLGNRDISFAGKAITVRSTDPQDPAVVAATVIDCENLGSAFYFYNSEGANSVIDGLTITNAGDYDYYGGGIYCDGSSPTVANCRILNSLGYLGGGICNDYGSSPTLVNCVFSGNVSDYYGGAICNIISDPNIINCTFVGNVALEGGGAIYNDTSWPTLSNCVFSGNNAEWGGGIFNDYDCISKVTNCTFSDNLATDPGGAILNFGSSITMLNNCILWGNGPDEVYVNAGTVTVDYSNVQGGYYGTGNINEDPLFVDADGPDDVVGTEDDNLRLLSGSPCIDAGDSTAVGVDRSDLDDDGSKTEQAPWDLDGNLRFLDDPNTTDTGVTNGPIPIVDMGAYESSGLAMVGDFEPDGDVDLDDLGVIVAWWLQIDCGECGGGDLGGDGNINLTDFATFAKTGLVGGGGQSHKPILAQIGDRSILEEQNLNFTVSATDPDGDSLTYLALNLPSGAVFDPPSQVFDWTPAIGQTGQYYVTILVFDGIEVDSEAIAITVSPRPVGHWTMDDNASNPTVVDSSGNGIHGTAQQNTEYMSTPGIIDGALDFDGTGDYVDLGTSTVIRPSSQLSLACWLYVDELSVAGVINNKIDGQNSGYRLLTADTG
ncbi:MAG: putative Ig domain-containing protein, partial [Planctomycetota bacterium]